MRLDTDDPIWVVTDPTPRSELADICYQSSLAKLRLQFLGGLTAEERPTLHTDQAEAERDARSRLVPVLVAEAIRSAAQPGSLRGARRVQLLDETGGVVLETDLG